MATKKIYKIFFIIIVISSVIGITAFIVRAVDNKLSNTDNGSSICPDDMVYVSAVGGGFCIDKYEASPGVSCYNQEVTDQEDTRMNLSSQTCQPVSVPNAIPWRYISQPQAMTACAKAGKRLPTDEEWYLASLGTPDKTGNWTADDCQVGKNWTNQPGSTGSAKDCVSAAGAYDMVGNVWEWVKGEIKDGQYNGQPFPEQGYIKSVDSQGLPLETDLQNPDQNFNDDFLWIKKSDIRGMARGGYWDNNSDGGLYSMYLVSPPSFVGTGIGFRCVK